MSKQIHLVLDFDGTITPRDTGDELFRTFGQFEPIHSELLAGQMTVAEYYRRSVAMLQNDLSPDMLTAWARQVDVDPGLMELLSLSRHYDVHVAVASDGFDAYITPILERAGVLGVTVRANHLQRSEGGWSAAFPGATESCSCFCASCKRNTVLQHIGEHDILIFVGDGRSDTCAATHADVIFAKHHLAAWCTEQRIPHHPFKTLHDVQRVLASRFATDDLKPRRQAVLARARAIQME